MSAGTTNPITAGTAGTKSKPLVEPAILDAVVAFAREARGDLESFDPDEWDDIKLVTSVLGAKRSLDHILRLIG